MTARTLAALTACFALLGRRNRRLLLRVTVTVRDSGGRSATAARRLKLLPPRR